MQHLPSPLFYLIVLHLYIMQHNKALYILPAKRRRKHCKRYECL